MSRSPTDAPRKSFGAKPRPFGAPGAKPRPLGKHAPKPAPKTETAKLDPLSAPKGPERIAKVLSRAGVASRRDAEEMILEGRVTLNGKVLTTPAVTVGPQDKIMVDGQPLAKPEPPRLWMYHKPNGLVTTARDELGRPTVFDYLPEDMPRVMTVGRLDLNSEGLLLLTNDGELKRRLELPSTGWLRKYRVRINGQPMDTDFEPLRKGIVIDGEKFQPMVVTLDRQQGSNAWLTVGIREGRNREIRRTMEAIGLVVNRLIRVSYGPFQLGELPQGEIEEVRPRLLRDQLGLAETPQSQPLEMNPDMPRRAYGSMTGSNTKANEPARSPRVTTTTRSSVAGAAPLARGGARFGAKHADVEDRPARKFGAKPAFGDRPQRSFADKGERPAYGNKSERGERPAYGAKPLFGDRPQRNFADKGERGDRPAYGNKSERGERPAYGAKPSFGDRPQRSFADKGERGDRPAYGNKSERGERPAYGAKPAFGDRPQRSFADKGERGDRPAYGNKSERGERPAYGAKPSFGDRPQRSFADKGERGDRPAYGNKSERGERPAYGAKPAFGDRPQRSFADKGDRPAYGNKSERPAFGAKPERAGKPALGRGFARDGDSGAKPRSFGAKPGFGGQGPKGKPGGAPRGPRKG